MILREISPFDLVTHRSLEHTSLRLRCRVKEYEISHALCVVEQLCRWIMTGVVLIRNVFPL